MIFTKVGPQTQKLIKTLPKGQVLNCKNLKLKVRMNDRSHHHCPKDAHPMYCTKLPNQLGNFGSRVFSLPFCIPCYLTVSSARLTQKPKVLRTLWRWYCDSSEGEGPHDRFMRRFSSRWVVGVDSTDGRSGGLWPTGLRNAFFRKTQAGLVGGSQIFFFFETVLEPKHLLRSFWTSFLAGSFEAMIQRDGFRDVYLSSRRTHGPGGFNWTQQDTGICLGSGNIWAFMKYNLSQLFVCHQLRWFLPDENLLFWFALPRVF